MTEILTESFCERCGTRYTFELAVPSQRRLTGLKVLGRGLKNFVMSDDASLDEAMSAARSDVDRDATNHQLDAFHRTFSFCMSCRQYTCANCWNETEARCLSCEPLALDLAAAGAVPDADIEIDPARLLRFMGGQNGAGSDHEHVEAVAPAEHEHDHGYQQAEAPTLSFPEAVAPQAEAPVEDEGVEPPAAAVADTWPTTPAAPVSWPEGFVGSPTIGDEAEAAFAQGAEPVEESAVDLAPTLADAKADAPPETAPVEWWAQAEATAADQADAASEALNAVGTPSEPIAAEPEVAAAEPIAAEPGAIGEPEVIAEPEVAAMEPIAAEPEVITEPEVAAAEPLAQGAALSDALAEYEAAFSAPIPAPEIVQETDAEPIEERSQETAAELPFAESPAMPSPVPAPEAPPEPVFSEPEPRAVVDVAPAAQPPDATPAPGNLEPATPEAPVAATPAPTPHEPVAATPAATLEEPVAVTPAETPQEPVSVTPAPTPEAPVAPAAPAQTPTPTPTDHPAQPVWRAPADPASPAPQWPTGPRWPTGLPTGGAPSPLPPPVDALAALMARKSTEAMWAASSLEILQPASAAPTVAAIQSCGNCGISLSATARFCRRCGTPQG